MAGFTSLNNNGLISLGTIWTGTTPTALNNLPGSTASIADAINNAGVVAGYAALSNGHFQTVTWTGTTPTALNLPAGFSDSFAKASTMREWWWAIVNPATNTGQATIWIGTTAFVLNNLQGSSSSFADGINDLGVVVGASGNQAVIWTGIDPTPLDMLSGSTIGSAFDINNAGLAVGYSADDAKRASHALGWHDGVRPEHAARFQRRGVDPAAGPRHQLVWTDCWLRTQRFGTDRGISTNAQCRNANSGRTPALRHRPRRVGSASAGAGSESSPPGQFDLWRETLGRNAETLGGFLLM